MPSQAEGNVLIWPEPDDLKVTLENRKFFGMGIISNIPHFAHYDQHVFEGKLQKVWATKSHILPDIIPTVLPALSVTHKMNWLGRDYYCDIYAGLLSCGTETPVEVTVKMYKRTTCHWIDILKEASLLKTLKGTHTVPHIYGVTCVEINNCYWSTVVVCDLTGCEKNNDEPTEIITLDDVLNCKDKVRKTPKVDWIRFCITLTENLLHLHCMHTIPLNLATDNILFQRNNGQWQPYFSGLLHAVYDHGKSVLEINIQHLPLRSLKWLNLREAELEANITVLRRKRGLNINALGCIFSNITNSLDISFEGLVDQCLRRNPISRPTFQSIVEKLSVIGMKYEKRGRAKTELLQIHGKWKVKTPHSCCSTQNHRRNVSGADSGGPQGPAPKPQKLRPQHQNSTKLRPQNGSFRP